jgi:hypothetical protein
MPVAVGITMPTICTRCPAHELMSLPDNRYPLIALGAPAAACAAPAAPPIALPPAVPVAPAAVDEPAPAPVALPTDG